MLKPSETYIDRPTLTANEFQKLLHVSPNTFKKLLNRGKLPPPLPLGMRIRRWSKSAVFNFLNVQ